MLKAFDLVRMVTNLEGLLSIMLFNPLVTQSCEITSQTKTIISPQQRGLWTPILAEV